MPNQTPVLADPDARAEAAPEPSGKTDALVEEVLVEEVSIDGMCGVY